MMNDPMTVSRSLRTPRAAAIAGILFALLLTVTLVLLRLAAQSGADDSRAWLAHPSRFRLVTLATELVPFAGITFLWFIGVVRDRIGEREDRFFATVFLGSGLLFVGMLFVAGGVATGALADAVAPRIAASAEAWVFGRKIAAVLLNTYGMRMAAVFTISTATIGLRTGFIPRWLGFSGYTIAVILLLGINVTRWVELLFPLWILLLSIETLFESFKRGRVHGGPAEGR
jgi:hypothetical protein